MAKINIYIHINKIYAGIKYCPTSLKQYGMERIDTPIIELAILMMCLSVPAMVRFVYIFPKFKTDIKLNLISFLQDLFFCQNIYQETDSYKGL